MDSKKAERLYKKIRKQQEGFSELVYLPMNKSGMDKVFGSHGWTLIAEHDSGLYECVDPDGDAFLIKREDGPWACMVRIPKEKVQ